MKLRRAREVRDQRSTWNPIRFFAGSVGAINCLIAAKTAANFSSYFFSKFSILRARLALLSINRRSCTNVRMIAIFTCTARELRKTLESIATPCSVKAMGNESARRYFCDVVTIRDHTVGRFLEVVTICDLIKDCEFSNLVGVRKCSAQVREIQKSAFPRNRIPTRKK